ncbi:epoxide hydrolase [Streptomyces gardneri]|uniref:epoxide hydrolase family protein n=1 Tax=Nocardia TaxID=1817 RepID=UPI00135B7C90|nr:MULTISPECIES: epoxide hydrolase family protein [Nocardia]MBF6169160.1 epoxide hydrolase [Streptomyces gardneri]
MTEIHPFRIEIPQADLDDLNYRLTHARFADELPAEKVAGKVDLGIPVPPGWEYGVPGAFVRPLIQRWRDEFDWRAVEKNLNTVPHFRTEIDGQQIHFVHIRSANPEATPLMLTHGWPSSFVEYLGLVDKLTDAFHLVIPSYPGYAFSGPTRDIGWTPERMAAAYVELMRRLGYERYGVHGNDAGAIVTPEMGRLAPDNVIGVHVNQIFAFPSGDPDELANLSEQDRAFIEFGQKFLEHSIHDFSQRAQPQTIAAGLADSPVGQLTWSSQLLGALDPDDLLINVAIYWFTNTAASSARFYYENAKGTHATEPTTVPIGLASFGYDYKPPRALAERDHANIVQWNEYSEGGHWAAYEVPDLLATDIRNFFAELG